jgi:hypothetical protein
VGPKGSPDTFESRELGDRNREDQEGDDGTKFGLLMPDPKGKYDNTDLERYPEEWIDFTRANPGLKSNYKRTCPIRVSVNPSR